MHANAFWAQFMRSTRPMHNVEDPEAAEKEDEKGIDEEDENE